MTIKLPCILTPLSLLGLILLSPNSIKAQYDSPPSPHDHDGYSPSMATLFIVIIGLLFTVAFVSVYLKHFAWCLGLGPRRAHGQGHGAWHILTARGLDPVLVESYPTFLYSDVKQHRIGKGVLECAVCLNEFSDNEVLRVLPGCGHVFHPHCIRPWFACHVTCPLCRENLEFHQVGSIDTLATHLQRQLSENESEPSDHHQSQTPPHDHVMIKSPEIINQIKSPLQQIKDGLARIGKLHRSHSTGHSFIEDCERFTLRLPEEVRNKFVNPNYSPLPAMVSPRTGFRTRSSGLVVKPDQWRFSVSPPFFHQPGLVLSPRFDGVVDASNNNVGSRNLLKSIKSPLNQMVRFSDIGERSSDRLWPDHTVQDLDLESQK